MSSDPFPNTRRAALLALGTAGLAAALTRPTRAQVGASGYAEPPQRTSAVSVLDFGAVGDARTDDTIAFRRAIDHLTASGGGTLLLPSGDFLTSTVSFPYDPVVIDVAGAGSRRTTWRMADPATPIIQIDRSSPPNRNTGARFTDFAIAAHPRGRADRSDHIAIDAQGFNDVLFRNIRFLSTEEGSVGALFYTSASTHLTYHQRFEGLSIQQCVGPGRVIVTDSRNGAAGNTNLIFIDGFWIYANRAMEAAFDLNRCSLYAVRNGLIESSGNHGIVLGNAGLIESVWFEAQGRGPLRFVSYGDGAASSNNLLQNLYLSGFAGRIDIPTGCVNNTFQNVTGGTFEIVTEDPLTGNVATSSGGQGGKPGVRQVLGRRAPLREVEAVRVSALDGHWQILYAVQVAGPGNYGFRFDPPAGRRITKLWVSANDTTDASPVPCAVGWPPREFFLTAQSQSLLNVVVQLSYE